MSEANLIKSVVAYKAQRAKVKQAQKAQLEEACEPWAADVGDEIIRLRETERKSISDIAKIIGIENRTFIYSMITAAKKRIGDTRPLPVGPNPYKLGTPGNPLPDEQEYPVPYVIEYYDGIAVVIFDESERYEVTVVDGTPDLPEEWAEHTKERRALYGDIIKAIRAHDWN